MASSLYVSKLWFISSSCRFGHFKQIESEGDQNKAEVTRREQLQRIDTNLQHTFVSISFLSWGEGEVILALYISIIILLRGSAATRLVAETPHASLANLNFGFAKF